MSQSIDTGVERTPPAVSAMKSFKEKLLQGHKVKASQFGIELPVMKTQDDVAYGSDDEADPVDSLEEDTGVTDVYQDPDEIGPMEGTTSYTTPYIGKAMTKRDPVQMLSDYLEQTPAKEEVKIVGPFGKLGFKALNVSITEFGVAFIIKRDAIQFEPNINTELTIQYRGQDYSVIYAGGFFTFPKIPFTFVSFLRIQTE
jgi:hypothetical protein